MTILDYQKGGMFTPDRIAAVLMTTRDEIARTVGLGRDAIARAERVRQPRTQRRLREMIEIVNLAAPRMGSAAMAYAWYRSEPLDGFDGMTPMDLVQAGHADWVRDYLARIDAGVFA
ncbi:antitoxin Xre/MbcA/ParS toxin-binding domain-containing protein [Roseovarius aquimarinus]|uniref:Antitoxin Xre/MbcA/ParS toxin-binding domain-containing protein n=1 Tax=Roseovarius aquimarinus TaxID=1229156 RepID=A0ABW7IBG4_9RHOB